MSEQIPSARMAVQVAAAKVREFAALTPRIGLVLGSGLGRLSGRLEDATEIPYARIPNMPLPAVAGHSGKLSIGRLGGITAACLQGRVHLYEGHSAERVVFGVRLLAELGCECVVLTNAAGATTVKDLPGSILLLRDHINLTGHNPLIGYRQPTEFVDLSAAYDLSLRAIALACAADLSIELREGVYAGLTGPSYETKSEVEYLARIGADAVGMSTVLETIALCDAQVRVLAFSCITNAAAGIAGAILNHAHVQAVAHLGAERMEKLILGLIPRAFGA